MLVSVQVSVFCGKFIIKMYHGHTFIGIHTKFHMKTLCNSTEPYMYVTLNFPSIQMMQGSFENIRNAWFNVLC